MTLALCLYEQDYVESEGGVRGCLNREMDISLLLQEHVPAEVERSTVAAGELAA